MENNMVKGNDSLESTNSDQESNMAPAYSPIGQEKTEETGKNIKRKNLQKSNESSKNDSQIENDELNGKLRKNNEKTTENSPSKKRLSPVNSKNAKIPNLPEGWTYKKLIRKNGPSAGKIDFHVFSPEGKKFRTLTELKQFLNKTLKYQDIIVDSYDFFKFGLDKSKGSIKKQTRSVNKNEGESPKNKKPEKKQLRSVIKNSQPLPTSTPKRKLIEGKRNSKKSDTENVDNKLPLKQRAPRLIFPQTQIWIPPKSPYKLIQEDLYNEPWQLLIATIFLNCTKGDIALPLIEKFLEKWPYPRDLIKIDQEEIKEFIKPIGLEEKRAYQIKRFTEEYLNKTWKYPQELYGIGKYGNDSYRIFCMNEWKLVRPHDMRLTMYLNWLWTNHEYLHID